MAETGVKTGRSSPGTRRSRSRRSGDDRGRPGLAVPPRLPEVARRGPARPALTSSHARTKAARPHRNLRHAHRPRPLAVLAAREPRREVLAGTRGRGDGRHRQGVPRGRHRLVRHRGSLRRWAVRGGARPRAPRRGRAPGDVVVATKWWPTFRFAGSIRRTIGERRRRLAPSRSTSTRSTTRPRCPPSARRCAQWPTSRRRAGSGRRRQQLRRPADAARPRRPRRPRHPARVEPGEGEPPRPEDRAKRRPRGGEGSHVTVIAYSPLAQGLLTGKFHDDPDLVRRRPGFRRFFPSFRRKGLGRSRPVVDALREIAAAHGATPGQIALAWLTTFYGETVVAIPGATSERQAARKCRRDGIAAQREGTRGPRRGVPALRVRAPPAAANPCCGSRGRAGRGRRRCPVRG